MIGVPNIASVRSLAFRKTLASFLAIALLMSQWMGGAHHIAHPNGDIFAHAAAMSDEVKHGHDSHWPQHSCSAFDAATIGDCLTSPAPFAPSIADVNQRIADQRFRSRDALAPSAFHSRGPPLA